MSDQVNVEAKFLNLKKGLVAYYPFNGNADDESGNNHNGNVTNALLSSDRFLNKESAFKFNKYSHIKIPDSTDFGPFWYLISWNLGILIYGP